MIIEKKTNKSLPKIEKIILPFLLLVAIILVEIEEHSTTIREDGSISC